MNYVEEKKENEIFDNKISKEKLQEWIDEGLTQEEVLKKLNQAFPSLIDKLKEFGIEEDDIINQFKKAEQGAESYVQSLEEIQKQLDKAKNAYDALANALDEYNNSGYISYDTYNDLLDVGEGYISVLFDENGAIINNTEAIANLIGIKLQQKAVEQALAYLQTVATTGMSAYTDLINAQTGATQALTQAQLLQAQTSLLQIKDLDERRAAAERFVAIVNSVNNVSLGGSKATNSNSEAKKKAKEIQDQYNSVLEYAKTVLDEEIEKLEEEKEAIEERNEALQEELDIYDKALAYINKYISGKINALEKEKQALQEKNDEQERELELEELRNNINKNHQRTMRTYSEDQGWTWVVDPEDIKETEDAIKEYNKKVAEYEKEDEIAKIEEQIEAWEQYLAKWEEVPDVYEEMEAKIAFESLSAYVTEKDLLNKRTTAVDNFKKSYVKKQKEISKNTTEEVDKQIKKLQDIKEKWESIPNDYETASNKLNAEMILGKDAREKILSGEAGVIQNFASAYAVAMKNAEKAAKEGASGISSALSNISLPKITVNDILGKGVGTEEVDMTIGKNAKIKGDTLYNPFTKRYYYLDDMVKNEDGTYTAKAGTFYFTTAYASGTLSAKAGLANVDEKGSELIVPKQGRYRMMEYGDTVVPHNLSQRLFDVATNPLKFIANAINSIKSPILNEFGGNNNTTTISIGNITMPQSINNADKFVRELQIIAANR